MKSTKIFDSREIRIYIRIKQKSSYKIVKLKFVEMEN